MVKRTCPRCEGRILRIFTRGGGESRLYVPIEGLGFCETERAVIDLSDRSVAWKAKKG